MSAPLLLAQLDRERANEVAADGAIVLVPVGATEQHGPHLPLATDTLHTEHVAVRAAERLTARPPVVVAPALPYGCSAHHVAFGGTASLSAATFLAVLTDLGDSLAGSGFRRIFIINGHGGNHHLAAQAAHEIALRHGIAAASASWWHLAAPALIEAGALDEGNLPGHAGAFETALIGALRPELVGSVPRRDAGAGAYTFDEPLTIADPVAWQAIDGWSDDPGRAVAEHGRRYLELGAIALAEALERFASEAGRA